MLSQNSKVKSQNPSFICHCLRVRNQSDHPGSDWFRPGGQPAEVSMVRRGPSDHT